MPSSLYRLADRLTEGTLADLIARKRSNGESFDRIARYLAAGYGIEVTGETVRAWHQQLEETA